MHVDMSMKQSTHHQFSGFIERGVKGVVNVHSIFYATNTRCYYPVIATTELFEVDFLLSHFQLLLFLLINSWLQPLEVRKLLLE